MVYIDDILVTGSDEGSHLKSLEEVLKHLFRVGLRANGESASSCQHQWPIWVIL